MAARFAARSAICWCISAACAALALGKHAEAEEWLRAALVYEDREELRQLLERAIGDRSE